MGELQFDDTFTPPFFNVHLYDVSSKHKVIHQLLCIHFERLLDLTLVVAHNKGFHPLFVIFA